jgi:threonine-phosphate decarboxylase
MPVEPALASSGEWFESLFGFLGVLMSEIVHGGQVEVAARELGKPISEIIDFSANINPLGHPNGLKFLLQRSISETIHYPEIYAQTLTEALAHRSLIPPWTVLPGAGTTPLIYMLARHFASLSHIIVAPAFAEYEAALNAAGKAKIHYHILTKERRYLLDDIEVNSLLSKKFEVLILANPANPTGRLVPQNSLVRLLEATEEGDGFWLIIDEAFIDFCLNTPSAERMIAKFPRLILLKSLTKIFAVPGLRLGYLACGHRRLMKALVAANEPWSINSMAQAAGRFLVTKKDFVKKTATTINLLKKYLEFAISPYVAFVPSDCNFLMGLLKKRRKKELIVFLRNRGILIRDLDGMPGLPDGFIRLAVRRENDVDILAAAMKKFYS